MFNVVDRVFCGIPRKIGNAVSRTLHFVNENRTSIQQVVYVVAIACMAGIAYADNFSNSNLNNSLIPFDDLAQHPLLKYTSTELIQNISQAANHRFLSDVIDYANQGDWITLFSKYSALGTELSYMFLAAYSSVSHRISEDTLGTAMTTHLIYHNTPSETEIFYITAEELTNCPHHSKMCAAMLATPENQRFSIQTSMKTLEGWTDFEQFNQIPGVSFNHKNPRFATTITFMSYGIMQSFYKEQGWRFAPILGLTPSIKDIISNRQSHIFDFALHPIGARPNIHYSKNPILSMPHDWFHREAIRRGDPELFLKALKAADLLADYFAKNPDRENLYRWIRKHRFFENPMPKEELVDYGVRRCLRTMVDGEYPPYCRSVYDISTYAVDLALRDLRTNYHLFITDITEKGTVTTSVTDNVCTTFDESKVCRYESTSLYALKEEITEKLLQIVVSRGIKAFL